MPPMKSCQICVDLFSAFPGVPIQGGGVGGQEAQV